MLFMRKNSKLIIFQDYIIQFYKKPTSKKYLNISFGNLILLNIDNNFL